VVGWGRTSALSCADDDDDVARLARTPHRRISAYDLDKSRAKSEIAKKLKDVAKKAARSKRHAIAYLKDLIARHGKHYARRTKITSFQEIDKKAVARPTLARRLRRRERLFGTAVKGDKFVQKRQRDTT